MKLLFLDWDGPFENPATYAYRNNGRPNADPRVVFMANHLVANGWRIVLTSTIRKNEECKTLEGTIKFMRKHGLEVFPKAFYQERPGSWRTDLGFHGSRYDEVCNWFRVHSNVTPTADMITFDDELVAINQLSAIVQPQFDAMNGLHYTGTGLFLDFCKRQGIPL